MQDLITMNNEQMMTLRSIAEVLKMRNDNIIRSAKKLSDKGVIQLNSNGGGKIDQLLNKIDSITLVAQNK